MADAAEFSSDGCLICSYDREPSDPLPHPCPHTPEERTKRVLRLLWDTLVPNNLAHQPDGYQLTGHLYGVKRLDREEALAALTHRDDWNERKGFQRGLTYAIYYLDLARWHDTVDSVVIITETMRAHEAMLQGEPYEIKGFPYIEEDED
jgi:hypothetical protein